VQPTTSIEHSLAEIISALDAKIAALENAKTMLKNKIASGKSTPKNIEALEDVVEALEAAENGKTLLMASCCVGQNCNFDYDV
jgi:Type III secretion system, cytoplasmic E component of needle